uniref:Uncharacterized protein n=1 Tax=Trichogramma kaykai TaxID=54128 RepID=A0ABD2XQL8_9HYME
MSIWPFYLMVNELPYKLRIKKENVILAGLWFGVEKPSENLFMESMIEQLNDLYNGINVEILKSNEFVKIRGIILSGTCDLPAKALFMNIKQFNSCHGCPNCKIKTRNLEKTRVYPYVENLDLRTTKETRLFATQAHETNKSVFGVKGPSVLNIIVNKYVESTAIDAMHCCYQGVTKKLMLFWFDPEYRTFDFSLFPFIDILNQRIKSITLPSFVPRVPRKINVGGDRQRRAASKPRTAGPSSFALLSLVSREYIAANVILLRGSEKFSQSVTHNGARRQPVANQTGRKSYRTTTTIRRRRCSLICSIVIRVRYIRAHTCMLRSVRCQFADGETQNNCC